ncbi:hypothetical protein A6R68_23789, partial [Neotoma lepida]
LPEDDTIPDEEHFIDIEDTPGYQTAFSQLAFAGKKEHDPVGQMVNNPKIHLAQSLHKLSTACPGRVPSMVSTSLNAEALQYLQGYLQAASGLVRGPWGTWPEEMLLFKMVSAVGEVPPYNNSRAIMAVTVALAGFGAALVKSLLETPSAQHNGGCLKAYTELQRLQLKDEKSDLIKGPRHYGGQNGTR